MPNYIPIQDLTGKSTLNDTDFVPVTDGISAYGVRASLFKSYASAAAEAAAEAAAASAAEAEMGAAQVSSALEDHIGIQDAYTVPSLLDTTLDKLAIERYGYKMTTAGWVAAEGYKTVRVHLYNTLVFYMENVANHGLAVTLSFNDGASKSDITSKVESGRYYTAPSDIYISFNTSVADVAIHLTRYKTYVDFPRLYYSDGFTTPGVAFSDGTITPLNDGANVIQKIPVNGLTIHHDNSDYNILGCCFDENDNYIGSLGKAGGRILTYPYGTSYIMLTRGPDNLIYYDLLTAQPKETHYRITAVDKLLDFEGKNCIAFGDSIMLGYWSGVAHPDDAFIKLFLNKVGASGVRNAAVGGATYSSVSGATSIISEMQGETLSTRDFIFILAGTNDYARNQALTQVQSDLDNIASYIAQNKKETAQIIVITPLNRTMAADGPGPKLDDYRDLITSWALINGYSVVDGANLGLSGIAGTYNDTVTADGLHPNQLGHQIIEKALASALL